MKKNSEIETKKSKDSINKNKNDLKFLDRKGSILKLKVTSLTTKTRDSELEEYRGEENKTKRSLVITDSMGILTDSLRNLCKKYDVDKSIEKGDFPYDFANENTLFYVGKTPDYKYYEDLDKEIYNKNILKNN